MEQLDHFYGYFNLTVGIFFLLVGFGIIKSKKDEEGEKRFQKLKTFYQVSGAVLLTWGLVKIF